MKDADAKLWLFNTCKDLQLVLEPRPTCHSDMSLSKWYDEYHRIRICIEYENSSRGMVSHVCKHYRQSTVRPFECRLVIFIRTEHHKLKHGSDYLNAMSVVKRLESDNYKVLVFDASSFLQVGVPLLKNISEIKSLQEYMRLVNGQKENSYRTY